MRMRLMTGASDLSHLMSISTYRVSVSLGFQNWSIPSIFRLQGMVVCTWSSLYAVLNLRHRPAEASRALRKKLKHGDSHQQYRALVVSIPKHVVCRQT